MIKCIRIGSQLEEGKDQIAFYDTEKGVFFSYDMLGYHRQVFDSWQDIEDCFHKVIVNNGIIYSSLSESKKAYDEAFDIKSEPYIYPVLSKEEADKQLKGEI